MRQPVPMLPMLLLLLLLVPFHPRCSLLALAQQPSGSFFGGSVERILSDDGHIVKSFRV
jgi:hypothetical protein